MYTNQFGFFFHKSKEFDACVLHVPFFSSTWLRVPEEICGCVWLVLTALQIKRGNHVTNQPTTCVAVFLCRKNRVSER